MGQRGIGAAQPTSGKAPLTIGLPMAGLRAHSPNGDLWQTKTMDPLDDLPPESRAEVVAAVCEAWETDVAGAESILRASEPLWNTLEEHGGVDGWGGGEFCNVFPMALAFIRNQA